MVPLVFLRPLVFLANMTSSNNHKDKGSFQIVTGYHAATE